MKIKNLHIIFIIFITLLLLQSCKKEQKNNESIDFKKTDKINPKETSLSLKPVNNSKVFGSIVFKESDDEIIMIALINSLKEGIYEMYITNSKDCTSFNNNEDLHWNPTNQKHGAWGDKRGYHKGDIGIIKADVLGNGMLRFSTNEWCISCDDETKNIIGKRLIVTKNNMVFCCGLIE